MTILIADDEVMNREVLREFLEARGYTVSEACDGEEAYTLASAEAPNAILMDIRMPKADGFTALARLRSDRATASIPVIAVTAFAMDSDRQRAEEAGFDAYVTKPIDFRALNDTIRRVVKL